MDRVQKASKWKKDMKKTYVKPEIQVFLISKPMLLAGSDPMKASFSDDDSSIEDGGDTSSGGIYSID